MVVVVNAAVLGGALLYLLAGLWPSLSRRGVAVVQVRLTVCALLLLGAAVSIAGGLLAQRTLFGHVMFGVFHGVVIVIAIALAAGELNLKRR
jgi:hypothetical protein